MTEQVLTESERKDLLSIHPTNSDEAKRLYRLLWEVYTEVFAKAYFITSDYIKIHTDPDGKPFSLQHVPAAIIVAHLVNRSATLLEGPPGSGKTKIVRIMSRLMTGSSMSQSNNIIYCDEQLDKDKWMGTPNIAKLVGSAGEEKGFEILWADWIKEETDFIVDEINRANPHTQNEFLLLMSEGKVQYDVKHIKKIKNFRMFMTQNPLDEMISSDSIYPLDNAFKDRITQCIKVPQPPRMGMKMFSKIRKDERNYDFNEDSVRTIMTLADIQKASILASRIPISPKADDYANYLARDLTLCIRAPFYDKAHTSEDNIAGQGLCNGCHYMGDKVNYNCDKFYGTGGSMRMYNDLIAVSKAYAFFLGLEEVNEHLIHSIAMDVLAHRVVVLKNILRKDHKYGKWKDSFIKQYLVEWCFQNLSKREQSERSHKALYEGRGTEKDVDTIWKDAQNDLYVRFELMPRILALPEDLPENLQEVKRNFPTATDPSYKKMAISIMEVNNSLSMTARQKFDELNKILSKVMDSSIKFSGNLVSMIYMAFPGLLDEMERKR